METLFGLFDRPPLYQLVVIAVVTGLAWAGARLLLDRLHRRLAAGGALLPVAPFFVSVTTVFALFLGFLAADVWDDKQRASDAAYRERSALQRFVTLVGPGALDDPQALAAAARYRSSVVEREWRGARNAAADPQARAALRALWAAAARLSAGGASSPAAAHLFAVLDDLEAARAERLSIGADAGGSNAWYSVLALWLFSFAALAAVHLDRPPAGRLALTLFALATGASFFFLVLHDSPYGGGIRIDSGLLAALPIPAPS